MDSKDARTKNVDAAILAYKSAATAKPDAGEPYYRMGLVLYSMYFAECKDDPQVGNVRLLLNGRDVDLHSSWALRPVLVLETRGANLKTRLVFSRGEIAGKPADPITSESVSLETLVFERDAAAPSDAPFVKTGGATCTVKYRFQSLPDYPCYRSFDPDRPMRASAAAKMQASQLIEEMLERVGKSNNGRQRQWRRQPART